MTGRHLTVAEQALLSIRDWPAVAHHALAQGLVALAVLIRWWLDPLLGNHAVFITLFLVLLPMVLVIRPSAFLPAALVGMVAVWFLFVPPRGTLRIDETSAPAQLLLFVFSVTSAAAATWLSQRLRDEERHNARDSRQQEIFTEGLLGSIADAFLAIDAQWNLTFVNAAAEKRIGRPRAELLKRNLWSLFPEAVGNEAHRQLHIAMRDRVCVEYEVYFEPRQRWYRERAYPTADGGLALYTSDITETRRALDERARQSAQLRLITDAMPALISYIDRELRYQFNNKAYEGWFGTSREALRGRTMREVLGDAAFDVLEPHVRAALAGECRHFEALVPYAGGGTRHISAEYVPDRHDNGEVAGFFVLVSDVSERQRAETALRESHAELERFNRAMVGRELRMLELKQEIDDLRRRLGETPLFTSDASRPGEEQATNQGEVEIHDARRAALNLMDDALRDKDALRAQTERIAYSEQTARALITVLTNVAFSTDADACFVEAQSAWQAYTGQSWEQHRGLGWIEALHPDDRDAIRQARLLAIAAKHPFSGAARLWHQASESYRHCEARATPVFETDGSGRIRAWVGAITDIHDRKLAEDALRLADRRKDEFLATLAHELRNPLAPLSNSLHILRLASGDAAAQGRVLDMMERQLGHIVRLVDDLLEISRISRGNIDLRIETFDLVGLLRASADSAATTIEASGNRLHLDLPDAPLLLDGDPVRIAQIVGNLLNNAAKYTERGGRIGLHLRRDDTAAEIRVRDTGLGIPIEMLGKVFDLFTQIDRTLGRAQGGLGIGLSLVKSLVGMHGGSVEARSEGPGRGSEFIVRLPLAQRAAPTRSEGPAIEQARATLADRCVVVIDDSRDAADSLAALLRLLGAEVHTAYDGAAGIEALRAHRPGLVFLDLGMPGMDGYEVAAAIRADAALRKVKLVALTGWGQERDRRRTEQAGFDLHLVKPVTSDMLSKVV